MTASATWLVYQPIIVGLGAVVVATIGQTLLEWYRQRSTHSRRAATVRRAFAEELRVDRSFIEGAISEDQKNESGGSFLIPLDKHFPVYDNMIGDVGYLEPDEVAAVIKAYSNLLLIPKNFALMGQIKQDAFASFAIVDSKYIDVLISMNQGLLEVVDEAIVILDPRLSALVP
ncbi:MAG: hypothetical protein WBR13_03085 [Allosphingosinicella sp.]